MPLHKEPADKTKARTHLSRSEGKAVKLKSKEFESHLAKLQAELVKVQLWVQHEGIKVVVIFEGRDAAGKGGVIKRITERVSPRVFRLVALPAPTEREKSQMYVQRYLSHLPAAGEVVIFDRSWYNRAGVEYVMKFCTRAEREAFLEAAPRFERMLTHSGISVLKYYLDISRKEQARRLRERRHDPLKQWKISAVDKAAPRHWRDYSRARDTMLLRTHHADAPWILIRADDKHQTRLNVIRDMLARIPAPDLRRKLARPDPRVAREFDASLLSSGWVAR